MNLSMSEKPTYEELEQRLRELEDVETRRTSAEEALVTQRQELISIFDSIDEAIYVCDPETYELLYVNVVTKAIFGPDIVGKKCYHVFQGLDEPCVFCTNPMIFGKNLGKPYVWEFQNTINGRWYRCIDKAIKWPDGRMVRYEMAIDIHDLKQAQNVLRESEERYRRITEAITDYIYTVIIQNGSAVETVHGAACEAVTGYTPENFSADPYLWIHMVHDNDREAVEKQAKIVLSGVKAEPLEHRIIRKDGAVRWVRNTPVSNFDTDGRLLSYDGLIQDITERKQAEEALRRAHDQLEKFSLELEKKVQERTEELKQKNNQLVEAERLAALGKMANRVAHELRNPLTAVGGFARRINEKTPVGDPNKKYLQMIVEKVVAMESKVSEITRIQSE